MINVKTMADSIRRLCLVMLLVAATPQSAGAHFQLIFTPEVNLQLPGEVPLKLIFWHPFDNGQVMAMERPKALFAVHRGERIDLMPSLKAARFESPVNEGDAFDAVLTVKRSGDYVIAIEPAPYFEESEDLYIQQFTKIVLNRNTVPTDWMNPVGLKAEIIPQTRPTTVIAGSTFTGRVMADGKPVPHAEIEIEYMAALPDIDGTAVKPATVSPPIGGGISMVSDDRGYFTYGIPKAGFWGFAALGVGPDDNYEGKALSQDAVIWIKADDLD